MTSPAEHHSPQGPGAIGRLLTLVLWTAFFLIGLFPDLFFQSICLLSFGWIPSRTVFPYSDFGVTVALSLYFGVFVFHQARAAGRAAGDASTRGVYGWALALVAFLGGVQFLVAMPPGMPRLYRAAVYVGMSAKLLAWVYLYTLVLRYYLLGQRGVFGSFLPLFLADESREPEHAAEAPREGQGQTSHPE